MYKKLLQDKDKRVKRQKDSHKLLIQAADYLKTYTEQLDRQLDSRLVQTFYDLFIAILCFRHTSIGLLLSELGSYILGARQAFRFNKSELAMQSPRLWWWENRLKLLAIVALIYDFLLSLIAKHFDQTLDFINKWCPRTGKRHQLAWMPLYRLRTACSVCIAIILNLENSG